MGTTFDTFCGLCCATCEQKTSSNCNGCMSAEGKPLHEQCEIAACAQSKNRRFCGECENFPCDILKKYSNDPENGDNGTRIENCSRIKSALVAEARVGLDPIAVCGFNCNHCFLGQWCGGCRSSYNCCSYGTLFEGNQCPNVVCATEKGLEGCYQCDQLDDCMIGYYSKEDEHVAKPAAKFIREYGKERSEQALIKQIKEAETTGKELEKATSDEEAFEMLKRYL